MLAHATGGLAYLMAIVVISCVNMSMISSQYESTDSHVYSYKNIV